MKKILFTVILLLCVQFFFSDNSFAQTSQKTEISKIEKQIFGFEYNDDSEQKRVERLEEYAYGATTKGSVNNRVAKLKKDLNISEEKIMAKTDTTTDKSSYYEEYYEPADETAQYPVIDSLEEKIFNKTNKQKDIYLRVAQLEKQIFKKEQKDLPLSERVEKLRSAVITDVAVAGYDEDGNVTITPTYSKIPKQQNNLSGFGKNNTPDYYSPNIFNNDSIYNQISILERNVLQETFPTLSIEQRLAQLETKVLQKIYSNDDNDTRVERLSAATEAQRSATHYSGSKFERNLATGMQIAGFILMILAFVL